MRRFIPNSAIRPAPFSLTALLLTGCAALYDDRCGPEGRDVITVADIVSRAGDSLGYADLQLGQIRDSSPSAHWYIFGTRLRGRIQSALLVTSEDTSSVVLQLTGGLAEPDIALEGESSPYTGTVDFDQLFTRARTGGLTVVLDTDLPSLGLVALPLVNVLQFQDWSQAHCS
jgi:hypothetical protein